MIVRRKQKAAHLLLAALASFVVFGSGTLGASSFPSANQADTSAAAPASDHECETVLDANDKLFDTPFHMHMTQTVAGVENGKPMATEMVSVGGERYILFQGKWSPSPLSVDEEKAIEQRNRKNARNQSCHHLRDESVNGESAALYSAHSESELAKTDSQIWISRSSGLILRQETDLVTDRSSANSHLSVRYEYKNVRLPKP